MVNIKKILRESIKKNSYVEKPKKVENVFAINIARIKI